MNLEENEGARVISRTGLGILSFVTVALENVRETTPPENLKYLNTHTTQIARLPLIALLRGQKRAPRKSTLLGTNL